MNVLFLIILMALLLLVALIIDGGDLVSPMSLTAISFLFSSLVALMHNGFGGIDISFDTVFFVFSSIVFFYIFCCIGKASIRSRIGSTDTRVWTISIHTYVLAILVIAQAIIAVLTIRATLQIAQTVNANSDYSDMLFYSRNAYLFNNASLGPILSVLTLAAQGFGYFITYQVVSDFITHRKESRMVITLDFASIAIFFISSSMGTGRTFLIKWVVFVAIVAFYLYMVNNAIISFRFSSVLKILFLFFCAIAAYFLLFQLLGYLTMKTGVMSGTDMLYSYSGASLIALDKAVPAYAYDGRFFGEESFFGLYHTLNTLGISVPNNIFHLPMMDIGNGMQTNIYTSLRTYLYDFGPVGVAITQACIGYGTGLLYGALRKRPRTSMHPIYLFFYSLVIYGLAMQGIEEMLLRDLLTVSNIISFIVFAVLVLMFSNHANEPGATVGCAK